MANAEFGMSRLTKQVQGGPGIVRGRPSAIPRLRPDEVWRAEWEQATFKADVLAGLSRIQKSIPPRYFYDAAGSALFDRICDTREYYVTRAELEILASHAGELAELLGPDVTLVELGSGSSLKTGLLLQHLQLPRAYVPVDLCKEALEASARRLHQRHPGLLVLPVRADFTHSFPLPPAAARAARIAVFFPGSTIGNLGPDDAQLLLRKIRRRVADNGWLIVGVDMPKPVEILERAYNDSQGLTAAFNRNLLVRIRDELGAVIEPEAFDHHAWYNTEAGRIEMHLRSREDQLVHLDGQSFRFRPGETLHTENSYKYSVAGFTALAERSGFRSHAVWHDQDGLFAVHLLRP
jgi:L-histidine N-alpha-methyltransferase